jgi:hypothetical protein
MQTSGSCGPHRVSRSRAAQSSVRLSR